jgi:hypothetical protein
VIEGNNSPTAARAGSKNETKMGTWWLGVRVYLGHLPPELKIRWIGPSRLVWAKGQQPIAVRKLSGNRNCGLGM